MERPTHSRRAVVTPVDLEPFRTGTAEDRRRTAELIDDACRHTGFLAVTGHGIPESLRQRMLDVTGAFFDRPLADKRRYESANKEGNRGYAAEGTEALSYSLGEASPPDLFEAFNIGREILDGADDPYVTAVRDTYFCPNIWPDEPADLRAVWLEYWDAVEQLGLTIMEAAALALGLPDEWFRDKIDRSISVMRAINYERRPGTPDPRPGQLRMGAHSDYGSITILLADDVPGLQVRDPDGGWSDVAIPAGGFIVNIGDLLAEWTNDRWRSTIHRVLPPPADESGSVRRRSVAWFQQPNWDAVIECIPTCVDDEHPARYRPVSSGEHLLAKLMGPRLHRPSASAPEVARP
jgi:isopenicillin N synthase-like dioxygenase